MPFLEWKRMLHLKMRYDKWKETIGEAFSVSTVQQAEILSIFRDDDLYKLDPDFCRVWLKRYLKDLFNTELEEDLVLLYLSLCKTETSHHHSQDLVQAKKRQRIYLDVQADSAFIEIEMSRNLLCQGTTGLSLWEASFFLADYLIANAQIVRGKRVLELGSGLGFLSLVCSHLGAKKVLATDYHHDVLEMLDTNMKLNPSLSGNITVSNLDWNNPSTLDSSVDLVICSDVVYDPDLISPLVKTIETILLLPENRNTVVHVCSTIRNMETFSLFMQELDRSLVLMVSPIKGWKCQRNLFFFAADGGEEDRFSLLMIRRGDREAGNLY